MPKATKKPTMLETVNVRFLNRTNGTIGCGSRCSTKKKTTQATAEGEAAEDLQRQNVVVAGDREGDEHRHEGDREQHRTGEVDVTPRRLVLGARNEEDDREDGEHADGHVHVEDPAPADVVREVATDDRADDRGE